MQLSNSLLSEELILVFSKDNIFNAIGKKNSDKEVQFLISLLADGEKEFALDNDDYYIHFHNEGVSLMFDGNGTLISIFLYLEKAEGFNNYIGWFGDGLKKNNDINIVEKILGPPKNTGGGNIGMFNRFIPVWSKYIVDGAYVQYRFNNNSIGLVVIFIDR